MKKTILAFGFIATLFSCGKDDETSNFVASNTTGITVIQGTITHSDFISGNEIALQGARVSVRIDNDDLYPNSPNAEGSRTYFDISDANGNYSIPVTTNSSGALARVTYSPVTLVVDPATGEKQTYSSTGTTNITVYTGVPASNDRFYNTNTNVDISNIIVDTAIVRGTLEIEHWVQQDSITSNLYLKEALPLANYKVILTYDQDPTTLQERIYEIFTDANGDFSFSVESANFDYNLDNDYRISVPDFSTTQDSILFNGSILSSTPGVFIEESRTGSIEGGSIDNARDLFYNNFIED